MSVETDSYPYEPITKDEHIRVLQLSPGEAEDRIQGALVQISLNEPAEYEALSYCWGDPTVVQSISCDDHDLGIASNAHSALLCLRDKTLIRNLWIDAICINQRDNTEKEKQISLMARIYAKATRVVVWLGDDSSDVERLDQFVDKALELVPEATFDSQILDNRTQDVLSSAMERERKGQLSWRHINWTRYHNLLSRPWFERKWVIQEIAWAKDAVVICGDVKLSWAKLADLTFRTSQFPVFDTTYTPKVSDEVQIRRTINNHNAMMMLMMKTMLGKGTVLDCVLASKEFKCTIPHDHVFALLPLSHGQWSLKPNYSSTIEDVFTDFAISSLVDGQNLKIFSIVSRKGSTTNGVALRLPSWVPDLTNPFLEPLTSYTVLPRRFFAGGDRPPELRILSRHQIECRGFIIDKVRRMVRGLLEPMDDDLPLLTGDPFDGMTEIQSRYQQSATNWVQAVQEVAGIDLETASVADGRALCRTMMCDLTGMRHRLSDDILDSFRSSIRVTLDVTARRVVRTWELAEREGHHKFSHQILQGLSFASSRNFCCTENGRMGQVPGKAEEGDQICIFLGAEVPHVLRPTGHGTFMLIGDCYLDGVMDGEVLSMDERNEQDIVLE